VSLLALQLYCMRDTADKDALLFSSNLCRHHSDVVETKRTNEQSGSLVFYAGGR
jgi:hypothetical protein